jgi:two-component system chemotaxis response regulator CheY
MNILIVDDFSTMRRMIRNILRQLGYANILEADDGTSAIEILRREKVSLIISDWNMPQMSGIELLKIVRASEEWKDLPFLMVTAEGLKQDILEAVKNRVDHYIVKPFTPETLTDKIRKILEEKKSGYGA